MSAHTPGPLKVVNGGLSQLAIVAKDGNAVAFVSRGHSDADANSNLFAAAPDLLAAARIADRILCGGDGCSFCAAIALAEGRS